MKKEWCGGVIPLRKRANGVWEFLVLLHHSGNFWGFPKGHVTEGEDLLSAAERELIEETTLKIEEILDENGDEESYQFQKNGEWIFKTVRYFPALVKGSLQVDGKEILEGKWCSFSEVKELLTFEGTKKLAEKIYNQLINL